MKKNTIENIKRKYQRAKERKREAEKELSQLEERYTYTMNDGDIIYHLYTQTERIIIEDGSGFVIYVLKEGQSCGAPCQYGEKKRGCVLLKNNGWEYAADIFKNGYCYDLVMKRFVDNSKHKLKKQIINLINKL